MILKCVCFTKEALPSIVISFYHVTVSPSISFTLNSLKASLMFQSFEMETYLIFYSLSVFGSLSTCYVMIEYCSLQGLHVFPPFNS